MTGGWQLSVPGTPDHGGRLRGPETECGSLHETPEEQAREISDGDMEMQGERRTQRDGHCARTPAHRLWPPRLSGPVFLSYGLVRSATGPVRGLCA